MSRPGYIQLRQTPEIEHQIATVCGRLGLDPATHSSKTKALRFALQMAALELTGKERTMRIETGFHGLDLLGEEPEDVDVAASAAGYAELLEAAIRQEFPEAEVVVRYDLDATGVLPYNLKTRIDDVDESSADQFVVSAIQQIHADVYEEWDWVVEY
jgi:hypothetical protein